MKKAFLSILFSCLLFTPAFADESDLTLKQGFLIRWDAVEGELDNISMVTLARTKPVESIGDWNILLDGWMLDAGVAYDAGSFNTVALLVGREFGTLGKYLPIEFPLKDKLKITIYPFGVILDDPFTDAEISGASGVGIINIGMTF